MARPRQQEFSELEKAQRLVLDETEAWRALEDPARKISLTAEDFRDIQGQKGEVRQARAELGELLSRKQLK